MARSFKFYLLLILIAAGALNNAAVAQYQILNKGIAGNSTQNLLARIDKDVLAEQPDLVILMAGTNDMVNSRKMISYDELEKNYRDILEKLKAKQITVVTMSPPPVDTGYLFLRHDRKLYNEDPNQKLAVLNTLVKKLAKAQQAHFIDLHAVFTAAGSPNRT